MKDQFKNWWNTLSEREQKISLVGVVCLSLFIIYSGIWEPLNTQLQENQKKLVTVQKNLLWVESNAATLIQSGFTEQEGKTSGLSLIESINKNAKKSGINFSSVDNKKDQVELSIEDVNFDLFTRWLTMLQQQYQIKVLNVDLSKASLEGHVKVKRLLLSK